MAMCNKTCRSRSTFKSAVDPTVIVSEEMRCTTWKSFLATSELLRLVLEWMKRIRKAVWMGDRRCDLLQKANSSNNEGCTNEVQGQRAISFVILVLESRINIYEGRSSYNYLSSALLISSAH